MRADPEGDLSLGPGGPAGLGTEFGVVLRHFVDQVDEAVLRRLAVGAQAWNAAPGTGGFVHARFRFIHEMYTAMARTFLHRHYGTQLKLSDPASILCFEDHNSYAHRSPTHVNGNLLPAIRRQSDGHRTFARENGS